MVKYTLRRKKQAQDPSRRLLTPEEVRSLFIELGRSGLTLKLVGQRLAKGHHSVSSWLQRESTIPVEMIPRLKKAVQA